MTIKLMTHKSDHIIGLEIDGWINAEDIDHIVKIVEPRIDADKKLRIYAEINSWSGMSLGAFIKDLKFGLQHLNDFEKEAIVSDYKWLEALTAFRNTLFSSIEVKHFTLDARENAWEWIAS